MNAQRVLFPFLVFSLFAAYSFAGTAPRGDPLMSSSHIGRQGPDFEVPGSEGNEFYRSLGKFVGVLTCTASFLKTSTLPDAPAYLISNGHCAQEPFDFASSNAVIIDKPTSDYAEFNYFHDSKGSTIRVAVTDIAYSTMKGTDISILKTDKTVREMQMLGLQPFSLSKKVPELNAGIVVSGIPITIDAVTLSRCSTGAVIDVVEYNWHWFQSVSNRCSGISSGSSGGPVFTQTVPPEIVGLINTTSVGAVGETCYMGNPCAVTPAGAELIKDQNYMVQTLEIDNCFDDSGLFSLTHDGCLLPKPTGLSISDYPSIYYGKVAESVSQGFWKFKLEAAAGVDKVRVLKSSSINATVDCRNASAYGPLIDVKDFEPQSERLPSEPGGVARYCVIAGNDTKAKYPEVIQVLIDNTAPVLAPEIDFWRTEDNTLWVTPLFKVPEYSDFFLMVGPSQDIDCATAVYKQFNRVPIVTPLGPTSVCIRGADLAQNMSANFRVDYLPSK